MLRTTPELLRRVRRRFPTFRLQLHEAVRPDAERLLLAGEIDLAIAILDGKRRPEIHSRPLLELPLILLVNKKQNIDRRVIAHWISNDGPYRRRSLVHGLLEGDREFDCSSAKEIAIAR